MIDLVLIRGLPGSGKTTMAKFLERAGFVHIEADQFFTRPNDTYIFDGLRIGEAHDWCQDKTEKALEEKKSVVVSNTFTRKWEMEPYVKMARQYDANLHIIVATGNHGSDHNIPQKVYENMKARWED